jgi:phosphoribosylaminoimidazolecarboxamide formyltransferase/IMP cyclohydrolase
MNLVPVKRALVSVSDKTDLLPLARALVSHGCEILASGGTANHLRQAGIAVRDVSDVTGNSEAFGGRMKTLSHEISSGILFCRERDAEEAKRLKTLPIDMVVSNLYPFEAVLAQGGSPDELIENIDIGGPTLVRAAAKNHRWVAILTAPSQYKSIIDEMNVNRGSLTQQTRVNLMREAFNRTADYDSTIAVAMDRMSDIESRRMAFTLDRHLEYGENPHQKAALFRPRSGRPFPMTVIQGRELSWNNIQDIEAAIAAVSDVARPGCAVVKHTIPCGLSSGHSLDTALRLAWESDPVSAFGGVLAFNRDVTAKDLDYLCFYDEPARRKFVDVIAAPSFSKDACDLLFKSKKIRVVRVDFSALKPTKQQRILAGTLMEQDADNISAGKWENTTSHVFPEAQQPLAEFGITVAKHVKSNAIVIVRDAGGGSHQILGIGAGQPNRVTSTRLAIEKAMENLNREFPNNNARVTEVLANAVVVSDAFFPFPDSIDLLAQSGLRHVIQPGGSIRDAEVVARAEERGLSMVITGTRHFKH